YLTKVWGNVPLILHSSDGSFEPTKRIDKSIVLDSAVADGMRAVDGLPWRYNGEWPEQQGQYRGQQVFGHFMSIAATKGAALDLLAHIYAWQHDYAHAIHYCDTIFNNLSKNEYELVGVDELTQNADFAGSFRGR